MSETRYFRPRNWSKFQSRSNNSMAWVKNFIDLLDKPEYRNLTENQRAVLHGVWLLCGRTQRPVARDSRFIGGALGLRSQTIGMALPVLESNGFIELCDPTCGLHDPTSAEDIVDIKESTDTSLRSVSSAVALNGAPADEMSQAIWGAGLQWLSEHTDKPPDKLRPLLGKWVKILGEGETFEQMRVMFRAAPVDPISWMERKCNERSGRKPSATATAVAGILGREA